MGMLGSVILVILGALACSSVIARDRPVLRFWLDRIVPFQGYLGVAATAYGLFWTVRMVAYIGFIRYAPFVYLTSLAAGVVSLLLGAMFGYRTMEEWAGNRLQPKLRARADELLGKLTPHRVNLGFAALGLGTFAILLEIVS